MACTLIFLVLASAASSTVLAKSCSNISARAPTGDVWKSDRFTARNTSCTTARAVMRRMITGGHIVGGGYGHYQVVGRAFNFSCSSRKAAVHYFEFLCRRGSASLHTFIADYTR